MNLENISYRLNVLVNELSENNSNHKQLNESILSVETSSAKCEGLEKVLPPEGLLSRIVSSVEALEYLVSQQAQNNNRSLELILGQEVEAKCVAKY